MRSAFGRCGVVILVIIAVVLGPLTQFVSPSIVRAEVERGVYTSASQDESASSLAIASPNVTTDDAEAGAILIAQFVARGDIYVDNVWICPVEAGWTHITGVFGNTLVVQHLWWRPATTSQSSAVTYTFVSREGDSCDAGNDVVTDMTGAITLYTGVDTNDPIGEVASALSTANVGTLTAPATALSHPAGSRIVRYFGGQGNADPFPALDSVNYYVHGNSNLQNRFAAAFDTVHGADGVVSAFNVTLDSKARWVAATVVLNEPGSPPVTDTTAPVTSASGGTYADGSWTNAASVTVTLSATDTGGSGVKAISYRTDGDWTTVPSAEVPLTISNSGETTITFFAGDKAGNEESPKTFVVRIDRDAPNLSGTATTSPNASGWYRGDVEIAWQCSDALSGIVGDCPADSIISGEGDNLSASASVADVAGNQQLSSVTGIRIDRTAPITAISSIPDWSNQSLTLTLTATDNLSGVGATFYRIDGGAEQSGDEVVFDQSGRYMLTYWSVDHAGNHEASQQVEVKVDTLAPTITHRLSTQPNALGWHTAPVTVSFECADVHSGIVSCSASQTVSTDGVGQEIIGTAVDAAGNIAIETATINVDQTAPIISAAQTPAANASGWNNTNVVVSFTCSDTLSGIVTCPDSQTVGEGPDQQVTASAVDSAGNIGTVTVSNLNVDLTAPVISAIVTTADSANYLPGTWTNQAVTVTFVCSDALSGIAVCPAPQVFNEGAGQSIIATAYDVAGNSASIAVEQINIDLTAPTISATLTTADVQPYTASSWAKQPVTVTFQCADGLSQVASCTAPTTLTDGEGQSLTGFVTDQAGNSASIIVDQINVDTFAPTITAVATTADDQPYLSGTWTKQTVTVAFSCADSGSGLASSCPDPVVISTSTSLAGQSVSAQISDRAGHVTASDVVVVKVDTAAPTFTATPDDLVVDAVNPGDTVVTWDAPQADDDVVGSVEGVCLPASGTAFAVGVHTITCTASDLAANVTTATFTVTIVEPPAPVLTVPDDITVPADGPYGAIVDYDPVTSDQDGDPVCSAASGSLFGIGTTTVSCSVSNPRGTQATATFTVTVLSSAELLVSLHDDTDDRVDDPVVERGLLTILNHVNHAIQSGDSQRALIGLHHYRMRLQVNAQAGRLSPALLAHLQDNARQVIDALR